MTTGTTRTVVAEHVAALQRGDLDALRASFAPKATWTIRGDLPIAGTWTGADEILDGFLAQVVATLDPQAPVSQKLHRIIADGEYAVAEWTSTARARGGAPYSNDYASGL
jgi:ketosteroid isomerase-like protein